MALSPPPPPVAWRPGGELGRAWEQQVSAAQAWLLKAQEEGTLELLDANEETWRVHLSRRFSYLYYTSAAHPRGRAEGCGGLVLSAPAAPAGAKFDKFDKSDKFDKIDKITTLFIFSPPRPTSTSTSTSKGKGDGGGEEREEEEEESCPPASLRLGRELGRGAFASVHAALVGEQQFALKRSLRARPSWNESLYRDEHFLRALAGHDGVVTLVSTHWDASGLRCLLMPMAKGDLHQERPPDLEVFEGVVRQLARALRHIHDRGVVHMDLKPQNVLVFQPGWVVRVTDFGSSLQRGHGLDGEKLYEYTRPYRAPELLTATGPKTARSAMDLWALGVLCWDIHPAQMAHPLAGAQNSAEQAVLAVALVGCCEAQAAGTWGLQGLPELAPLRRDALEPELRWATDTLLRPVPEERTMAPLLRARRRRFDDKSSSSPLVGGGPTKVEKTRQTRNTADKVEDGCDPGAVA